MYKDDTEDMGKCCSGSHFKTKILINHHQCSNKSRKRDRNLCKWLREETQKPVGKGVLVTREDRNLGGDSYCIMRCLWQERNARIFKGCKQTILDLKMLFFRFFFFFFFHCMLALLSMLGLIYHCTFSDWCWGTHRIHSE